MIVLGWSDPGSVPPAPCVARPAGDLALILAPPAHAASPRARLRLQLACADGAEAFLPACPTAPPALAQACHPDLHRALAHVRGRVQLVLDLGPAVEPAPAAKQPGGAAFLRARAARQRAAARLRDSVEHGLAQAADRVADWRWHGGGAARVDLLVPRGAVPDAHAWVSAVLAPRPELAGRTLLLSGPWPALAFADGIPRECAA